MRPSIYSNELKEQVANEVSSFLLREGCSIRTAIKTISKKHKMKVSSATYYYYKLHPSTKITEKIKEKKDIILVSNSAIPKKHSLSIALRMRKRR